MERTKKKIDYIVEGCEDFEVIAGADKRIIVQYAIYKTNKGKIKSLEILDIGRESPPSQRRRASTFELYPPILTNEQVDELSDKIRNASEDGTKELAYDRLWDIIEGYLKEHTSYGEFIKKYNKPQ